MRLASPYVGLLGCVVSATPLLISQWVLLGYFYRNAIPTDLLEQNPQPTGWGEPSAFLSPNGCNLTEHFFNHQIVFGKFWLTLAAKITHDTRCRHHILWCVSSSSANSSRLALC